MCGIAGKISFSGGVNSHDISAMCEKLIHRGPDDRGIFISGDKKVGFAHTRLSVIDLTPKGHQPMSYLDRYTIVYNGEIYNFREEKAKLLKKGVRFRSNSDTEVLLALYHLYKKDCLKYLRGMFSFAIYDAGEQTVFLARDRIGKKPLKYYSDGNFFIFASELKAILTQKEVKTQPDWTAISHYLTYGYVPAPLTGFDKIRKLEPGCFLFLDLKNGSLSGQKYWSIDFSRKLDLSEKEWCNKIIDTLKEATKIRMTSEVPLGAFLSGGVDSSAIVAIMAQLSSRPVKTFTITFKEKVFDESKYAKIIAEKYHTEHHELLIEPESCEILPELVYRYEEPYANASNTVAYLISKLARKYVTVALNGDGGDENFAGYDRYERVKRDFSLNPLLRLVTPFTLPFLTKMESLVGYPLLKRGSKFLKKATTPLADRYISYNSVYSNPERQNLLNLDNNNIEVSDSYEIIRNIFQRNNSLGAEKALEADFSYYLPDDLLTKMDIATMSFGLEARSPLLDQKFVEMAAEIPYNLKLKGLNNKKYIFKKALAGLVPEENLYRSKMGFSIPLGDWFSKDLNRYTASVLLNKNAFTHNLINRDYLANMLKVHSEHNDFGLKLWSILTLELWFKRFFN